MRIPRLAAAVVFALGSAALLLVVGGYLTSSALPLDDAWIHMVYGRALAQEGRLSYNPGIPATGATSLLWAGLLALPHLLANEVERIVPAVKAIGLLLHVAGATVLFRVIGRNCRAALASLLGGLLVLLHPDLVAASMSGMEVPLAALLACLLLAAAGAGRVRSYLLLAFLAPLARPELAVVSLLLPPLIHTHRDRGRLLALLRAGALGTALSFGLQSARNLAVSGRPLPATYYAKAEESPLVMLQNQVAGFTGLFARITILESSLLVVAVLLACGGLWLRWRDRRREISAALLAGLGFCAVSFALVRPNDPGAFYHQRYILPALPLLIAPLAPLQVLLLTRVRERRLRSFLAMALMGLWAVSYGLEIPRRLERLENDSKNIDDVQVALGRSLRSAPPSAVVWAIDAGAVRYFGSAFVVDLMGLNTPAMLTSDAQEYLDGHPPDYIEIVRNWNALELRSAIGDNLRIEAFSVSTPYTVTGAPTMGTHYLVRQPCQLEAPLWLVLPRGRYRVSCV